MSQCETCGGRGRVERGEFGGDCAAIHGGRGHIPDAPGWQACDDCGGTGVVAHDDDERNSTGALHG